MTAVGFFTVFRRDPQHYILADILVRSIRAAMPSVPIVQFTDETSPKVDGVDEVRRKPHGKMLERRMEHYAEAKGEWLLLDTDTVVQQDVQAVFDQPFDVAVADRNWPAIPCTDEYRRVMPFNTGVIFQRNPSVYQQALAIWRGFSADEQAAWTSEQRAVAMAVSSFTVHVLPGMVYNRPPATQHEDVSDAAIVHFKGSRKAWMRAMVPA